MAAPRVKPGDVLDGKYRVERVLGTGGMGMVVSARHVQLGQRVALKFMLKEAMEDPGNAERFAREARAAVRLQSAHTARVSDVGRLKNGEPYMVMEYLDGLDLDEVLARNGPMPPHRAVDYMLQACEAFAEAHSLGMIHRDIKPKNLFLSQTVSGRPVVKVLDFGLAKTMGVTGDVSLTATSAVFGSPQYMSPEQMRSAKDVDTRSDIWSIGVCLYELLTGHLPFDAAGIPEICAMVLKDPVEPPSKWARGLPPQLDAVIVKCLAKDPRERYQTVADLAFALEPWAAEEGSARRILHVMQVVQNVDVPTIVNMASVPARPEEIAKTLDAWDSGERTRTMRRVPHVAWWLGGSGVLAVLGLIAMVAAISSNKGKLASVPSAVRSSASPAAIAEPPPEPATPPAVAVAASTAASATAPGVTMTATAPTTAPPPPPTLSVATEPAPTDPAVGTTPAPATATVAKPRPALPKTPVTAAPKQPPPLPPKATAPPGPGQT